MLDLGDSADRIAKSVEPSNGFGYNANMIRAALILLLGVWATAFSLAAEKQTITIWGVAYGPDTKGFEALVREFERLNPEYQVRVLGMGAGGMNPQKLMTAIVGNAAPDVIKQDRFTISDWASRNAFENLSPLLERDKNEPGCPKEDWFYPATWAEASFNGNVYGIPESADNRILYWNRDIFRQEAATLRKAGLDPDRPPRTWSELLAYSKALTTFQPNGLLKRAGFIPNFGNAWLYMYSFQNNASFLSADGKTCTLHTPESEEALRFMMAGYDLLKGYENARAFESGFQTRENDGFISGKVAMKIDGEWILKDMARYAGNLNYDVAPPPVPDDRYAKTGRFAGEKDQFVTWAGGYSWAIPKGAPSKENGWKFIKFASSAQARFLEAKANRDWERQRGREYVQRGTANIEANELIFRKLKPADPRLTKAIRQHLDMLPYGRTRPVTFVGQRLWDEHVRAMERACMKSLQPAAALDQGERVVQAELDEYFKSAERPVISASIGVALAGICALALIIVLVVQFRKERLGALGKSEAKWGYVLISPWLIGFFIFTLGPMAVSLFYSFTQYNVLSEARWVGTENYQAAFGSDWQNVSKALNNALYLAAVGVPVGIISGLAVAMLLNTAVSGLRIYRTLFYMPAIVPVTVSAVLWSWILIADPSKGLVNSFWQATISQWFNQPVPAWLESESWSKPALIFMGAWGAGSGMLLWLAGLKGVSRTLYEAAEIDGATGWKQFWNVTLPQLSPIIFFNVVMGFISSLQEFDRVFIMKPVDGQAGPNDSLLVPVYHLFQNGFGYFKMGYASTLAWLIFFLIMVVTWIQWKLKNKWVYEEVER